MWFLLAVRLSCILVWHVDLCSISAYLPVTRSVVTGAGASAITTAAVEVLRLAIIEATLTNVAKIIGARAATDGSRENGQ